MNIKDNSYLSLIPPVTVDKVYNMIDEYVHQHHLGDVTPVRVDTALAQHTEHLLREVTVLCNTTRLELQVENKEQINNILNQDVKDKIKRLENASFENK